MRQVSVCALLAFIAFAGPALAEQPAKSDNSGPTRLVRTDNKAANDKGSNDSSQPSENQSWQWSILFSNIYYMSFVPLLLVTVYLAWLTRPQTSEKPPPGFTAHKWKYLLVWYMAVGADWLQGPYVYALYASYGYKPNVIGQLFVAGFGSSMLFGTFAGSMADSWGRKRCAILYCVLYAISCCTKHVDNYYTLMFGRVTGGIATSILFSTFECWMVAEHQQKRRFSEPLLRNMFGLMYFGMYVVAIAAGVVAQFAADATPLRKVGGFEHIYVGGYTAPFDLSLGILVLTGVAIALLWGENYGEQSSAIQTSVFDSASRTCSLLFTNFRICVLGLVISAFEGCMYAFVFNWTRSLDQPGLPPVPHGLVFALFMMSCVCGSSAFALADSDVRPSKVLFATLGLGACAFFAIALSVKYSAGHAIIFVGFLVFEFCVGMYFPAIGTLKSQTVPEALRASVYNAYRVPLNAVVCGLLLSNLALDMSFVLCCLLICCAFIGLVGFERASDRTEAAGEATALAKGRTKY